jgi:hypothetical protein
MLRAGYGGKVRPKQNALSTEAPTASAASIATVVRRLSHLNQPAMIPMASSRMVAIVTAPSVNIDPTCSWLGQAVAVSASLRWRSGSFCRAPRFTRRWRGLSDWAPSGDKKARQQTNTNTNSGSSTDNSNQDR